RPRRRSARLVASWSDTAIRRVRAGERQGRLPEAGVPVLTDADSAQVGRTGPTGPFPCFFFVLVLTDGEELGGVGEPSVLLATTSLLPNDVSVPPFTWSQP